MIKLKEEIEKGKKVEFQIRDDACGPAFSNVRPHSMGETRFLCFENHLKKRFGVATYFCFILKGKNKIRKKNPKYDS